MIVGGNSANGVGKGIKQLDKLEEVKTIPHAKSTLSSQTSSGMNGLFSICKQNND